MCSLWVYLLTVFMTHWSHTAKGDITNDLIPAENDGHKEIFGPEREKQTCQSGARQCHSDAVCMDYTDGFCCSCVSPAFGNGKHCVTTTDHHRIYGKVSGRLNGVSFDQLVMYAFIQTKTGRVYTAFSSVPDEISSEVITLNTIGGVFGWMFALKKGPGAKNGFMLTGGDLNRTARIQYQNGEKVVIEQMYMYHETSVPNKIQMETVIDGNIPKLKYRDQITIEDYNEMYRRVSPGIIRVSSDHTFHVNNVSSRFTLDQEIIFDECAFDPLKDKKDSQRLSVSRTFAVFEPDDKVVRFAMSYKIQRVTALFCPRPSQIQHGTIFQDATYGLVNDYKSVLEYSCDRGYYVNGNTQIQKVTRTCQSDGKWSGKEPTCEEAKCSLADQPSDANTRYLNLNLKAPVVAETDYIDSNHRIEVFCSKPDQYELYINTSNEYKPKFKTRCRNGKFTKKQSKFPVCVERRCDFYPSKSPETCLDKDGDGNCARGQFRIQNGTSIKVRCKTGYILYLSSNVVQGEGTITCNKGHYPYFRCSAVPALFRAIINITNLQYTDEIQAAGRDFGELAIIQQLQTALQNLMNTLRGVVRIRIVDLQPGSLMVTFDIDTDGQQTEEEVIQLLKEMLNSGSFSGYRTSPEGFKFRRIRGIKMVTDDPPRACGDDEWTCNNGDCIALSYYCNQQTDCYDNSDEENCPCPPGFYKCLNTTSLECVSTGLVCDKVADCSDGSDELNCV